MKTIILNMIFLLLSCFSVISQPAMNNQGTSNSEAIQQIRTSTIDNIQSFQTLNWGGTNYATTQQTGNRNSAIINQLHDATGLHTSNQSYAVQSGNSNELSIGQIGSGNLLLGFQLGYLSSMTDIHRNENGANNGNAFGLYKNGNGYLVAGENNKLSILQQGSNNGIIAVQQGNNNDFFVEQRGNNNYLLGLQKGTHNKVTGYRQENYSDDILFETIVQIGNNLSLKTDDASKYKPNGNSFTQTGTNLSLEVNNGLLNAIGGVEINQVGNDMKVVVSQSYFLFPMK
jgi:hypothetical protein